MVLAGIVVEEEDKLIERKVDLVCKVMVTWRYQSQDTYTTLSFRRHIQ